MLGVGAYTAVDSLSGRAELVPEASGNDVSETKTALAWARTFLSAPDWRADNLARIRDVIDNEAIRLHATMSGREEAWVGRAFEAYRRQDRPLSRHAESFLTRAHDAFTLSWRLEGGEGADGVAPFLVSLAEAGKQLTRPSLEKLALASGDASAPIEPSLATWVRAGRALPASAQSRVRKAGRDLGALLVDVPDESLASDWAALCGEMARGVARPPAEALKELRDVLAAIRHLENARSWTVGATRTQTAIASDLDRTLAMLDPSPPSWVVYSKRPRVLDRAHARGLTGDSPFVAIVNPSTERGSLVHAASSPGFDETRPEALIDLLAFNVFGGTGTQSFYKRIWGSALAYSGYAVSWAMHEQRRLYSDRCVDLQQLLRFVDGEVRRAGLDEHFVDYAIAASFDSRVGDAFEARARAFATDLANGRTPARIRAFRSRLLALRKRPGLAAEMKARFVPAMSELIPSLSSTKAPAKGALYFTVGPEPRLAEYEREVHHALGDGTKLLRLWPRDFWDVAD